MQHRMGFSLLNNFHELDILDRIPYRISVSKYLVAVLLILVE